MHYIIDAAQQHWLMVRVRDCSPLKKANEQVGDGFVEYWQDVGFAL